MKIVIAGLGVAGVNAARAVTSARPDAQVEIYGAEPHLYYARPKLPAFLAGEIEQDALYFYPQDWYREHGIAVHTGVEIDRIDPPAHQLILAEGTRITYDRLLLATGARPFVPPIEGAGLPGVFSLWTIEDALRIRAHARSCKRAVVIGGGLLGLEAARGLKVLGLHVTVLEFMPRLMPRQLDAEGAAVFQQLVEDLGIAVRVGAATECIEGASAVQSVLLKGGERLPADLVLISAGGRANIRAAQASGLSVNRGVIVDSQLRTSANGVYAAGDVAEFSGTVYGIIPAAIEQAQIAARNMVEIEASEYQGTVPANTLKIVGIDLTSIGQVVANDDGLVELRRTEPGRQYMKLVLKDNRLRGAILLGHKEKVNYLTQAVTRQVDVGTRREELLAEDLDWKSLLQSAQGG